MGRPVEAKRRKKKGRPSLLEIQKRSLRLQTKQQLHNPKPNPIKRKFPNNPYLRLPNSPSRLDPNHDGYSDQPDEEGGGESDEDDDERREKKLKLVLRIPPGQPELDSSASGSDADRRAATIGDVSGEKTESRRPFPKAGGSAAQAEGGRSDVEDGTPLPNTKLLAFILDRLQKKDTYGVFSDPVDPEELPDYHDIIKNPMDFSTIRKKLASRGAYTKLEQFEKDVFLICSNAMRYNAPDTVYFRQARSMQELAKKDFQHLREESEEDEPEQRTARRGRPSTKSILRKAAGRPAAHRASFNNSDATLANAPDGANLSKALVDSVRTNLTSDKPSLVDSSYRKFQIPQTSENRSWFADQKSAPNQEPSGSMMRGMLTRYGKKAVISEENHRNMYKQHPSSTSSWQEPSILATFEGESKDLVPVGLHIGYAYARSLARFAASLGPVAWGFAAKRIEMVLPPGTKFGRGWVGEQDAPRSQPPPLSGSSSSLPPPSAVPHEVSKGSDHQTMEMAGVSSTLTSDRSCTGQRMPSPCATPNSSKHSSPPCSVADPSRFAVHDESPTEPAIKRSGGSDLNPSIGPSTRPILQTTNIPTNLVGAQSQPLEVGSVSCSSCSITQPASTINAEVERTRICGTRAVSSFHSFFHPPGGSDGVVERASLGNSGSSGGDPSYPASVSCVEADRVPLSSSGNNFSQQGRFEMEWSKNPSAPNVGRGTSRVNNAGTGHRESEMLKIVQPNPANHAKDFAQAAAMNSLASERTVAINSNAINSDNSFICAPPSLSHGLERQKLGNPSTSGAMNKFSCPAAPSSSEGEKIMSSSPCTTDSCRAVAELPRDSQGSWRQLSLHQKRDSTPDLNVGFHSPTSPPSGMGVDTPQPDLALQL